MSEPKPKVEAARLRVGVSSCLLGEAVRFDGGHKAHSYIIETLSEYFEFRSFCPEIDIGMGIPRTPIRLSREHSNVIRCVRVDDAAVDYSDVLRDCADRQRHWQQQLCGYIFKKDSPSCGMEGVKVWDGVGTERNGVGVYADKMMKNFPYLPCAEESNLDDSTLQENFIQRVFAMGRWHELCQRGINIDRLWKFHSHHQPMLMSHDQCGYQKLVNILAQLPKDDLQEHAMRYLIQFMAVLKTPGGSTP